MKRTVIIPLLLLCISMPAADWKPVGSNIRTVWSENLNPEKPLPEYPRPQMVRSDWANLNGLWNYQITGQGAPFTGADGKILVPFCIESSLSGVGKRIDGTKALWYERSFRIPAKWKKDRVILHFGAVDWKAEIWIDGKAAGMHTGGYTPFSFDITSHLLPRKDHKLLIKVTDETDNSYQPRGKQVENPGTIWYTPVSGIWQTVWIERVPETHILTYRPEYKDGALSVDIDSEGLSSGDSIVAELLEGGVGYSAEKPGTAVLAKAGAVNGKVTFKVENPRLWDTENPYLYGLSLKIERNGKVIDKIQGYCALRTISVKSDPKPDKNTNSFKRMALNGKRTFFFGPLDQGWWPDGLYTAPSDEALRYDILKVKEWGWNMIRKHMKVEPARWYYWCDVMGITVWQDMPCIGDRGGKERDDRRNRDIKDNTRNVWVRDYFTFGGTDCRIPADAKKNYYKEWGEIIDAVRFFPCITVWTPFNEAWGQFDTREVVEFTKKKDPSRLVSPASGGNFTFCGDLLACHHYASPAIHAFSSAYVNVLAEYGGLGYPISGHLWKENEGYYYGNSLHSGEELLSIYGRFASMLKPMIDNGCSAAVYTEISDVEIEVNGIMTYDRKVIKVNENEFRKINREIVGSLDYEEVIDGKKVGLYTLKNGSLSARLSNFGGRLVSLFVPGKDGKIADVVGGHANLKEYWGSSKIRYMGATVGPVCNRIGGAGYTLDGENVILAKNNGRNTLHGGFKGLDMLVWDVSERNDSSIVFSIKHPSGLEGWPGNLDIAVTYTLTSGNELRIDYTAKTDRAVPVNLSNHSFFNLTGDVSKPILGHILKINGSAITAVDSELIPTGKTPSVEGTKYDFRTAKAIGKDIDTEGYDTNWCLDGEGMREIATLYEPESGRCMQIVSDQPGLQFYSGNFLDGTEKDRYGNTIGYRCLMALEPQKWPDAIHHPNFPDTILRPGETYTQCSRYIFTIK